MRAAYVALPEAERGAAHRDAPDEQVLGARPRRQPDAARTERGQHLGKRAPLELAGHVRAPRLGAASGAAAGPTAPPAPIDGRRRPGPTGRRAVEAWHHLAPSTGQVLSMKLLLRHEYDDDRVAFLRQHLSGDWEISTLPDPVDPSTLAAALASADAVVCMSWDARTPAAHALRLLQLPGAGFDEVDFAAVPRHCAVCNVFEHEIGIAEYLLLAILEWEIRLCRMDRELRAGRWRGSFVDNAPLHGELLGKSVGFVGYGRIAREAAQRLKAFGVRVLARTRSPSRSDRNVDDIAGIDRLDEMLEASDYVVVSCPLSDATRGIIDAAALSALGPDGVIINVARGPVIDEDALWAACRERRIAGAIIDTWYRYPEPGEHEAMPSRHPFHRLDNVIMTPHASAWSAGLLDRRWRVIADNLRRLARGAELRNVLKAPG